MIDALAKKGVIYSRQKFGVGKTFSCLKDV